MNTNEELFEISKEEIKKLTPQQIRFQVFRNKYPILYEYVNNLYKEINNWPEKLYLYTYDMDKPPVCPYCKKRKIIFNGFSKGYQKVCGSECNGPNKEFRKKSGKTRIKNRLNPKSVIAEPPLTKKIIKTKSSTFLREDNFNKSHPILYQFINSIYPNINKWLEKLYLYTNDMKEPPICPVCEINHRIFNSFPKGYMRLCSRECHDYDKESLNISVEKRRQTIINDKNNNIIKFLDNNEAIMKCPHPECNKCEEKCYTTNLNRCYHRMYNEIEPCTKLNPYNSNKSSLEITIQLFLSKNSIPFQHNIWSLIKNKNNIKLELDLYFPSQKLAIEINGEMYHNIDFKEQDCHIKKFQKCQEKGIELVSIWGEWMAKDLKMVQEFILDKLSSRSLHRYKRKWFSDLDETQWPNDLGWCKGNPPSNITPHSCTHLGFECFDSGLTNI